MHAVELNVLAKDLDEGSKSCCAPLQLTDWFQEMASGLESYLT